MAQMSLGLIETMGLTAAIEAADTAVKAADVRLVGYELAKGSGMTTVKLEGDVGAIKAAVAAASAAAARIGKVVGVHVIPRPAEGLSGLIRNGETVGCEAAPAVPHDESPVTAQPEPVIASEREASEQASAVEADDASAETNEAPVQEAPLEAVYAEKPEEMPDVLAIVETPAAPVVEITETMRESDASAEEAPAEASTPNPPDVAEKIPPKGKGARPSGKKAKASEKPQASPPDKTE